MNHCLKDLFAYCTGEPDKITTEETYPYRDFADHIVQQPLIVSTCRLDPSTCGKCQPWTEHHQAFMLEYCGKESEHHT